MVSQPIPQCLRATLLAAATFFCCGPAHAIFNYGRYANEPEERYAIPEARQIADDLLTYQQPSGGWPKNTNMDEGPADPKGHYEATIDNNGTYQPMRFLAHSYNATKDVRYRDAFLKGVDYLLKAQYGNGGWPQFYPLKPGYYTHITYNDGAMIGVITLLRDIVTSRTLFSFVDEKRVADSRKAVDRGIHCILESQIIVKGKRTAWCAQVNEFTLEPAQARAYELPSESGSESVGIVRFLMSINHPTPEVVAAVDGAVAWFEKVKIIGFRQIYVNGDKKVILDFDAPPMWARFYEIGTDRPFFCGRDYQKKYDLAQIEAERRNGYSWYGYGPAEVLEVYPAWKKRVAGEKEK